MVRSRTPPIEDLPVVAEIVLVMADPPPPAPAFRTLYTYPRGCSTNDEVDMFPHHVCYHGDSVGIPQEGLIDPEWEAKDGHTELTGTKSEQIEDTLGWIDRQTGRTGVKSPFSWSTNSDPA